MKNSGELETRIAGRLLVVDDDEMTRSFLRRLLQGIGYRIEEASSAQEALERMKIPPAPDLVLLDLHLPDRSGLEVLEMIRSDSRTRLLPVVMLTGTSSREERMRAIRAGVTDFVSKPFSAEELMTRVRSLVRLKFFSDSLEDAERLIVAMARTIDARDPYTAGHSEHVAFYAGLLGEKIGLMGVELSAVRQGGLFHDFGKIAIRDDVLFKPGRLSPEEYEHIKRHPVTGGTLLGNLKTISYAMKVVYYHHERMDGSGYPEGLSGESIPIEARVITIADVYDALTNARVYRPALTRADALSIMREEVRMGWWDGRLLDEFLGVLEKLPENDRSALLIPKIEYP